MVWTGGGGREATDSDTCKEKPLTEQQVASLISPRLDPISKVDEYEREALL